MSMREFGIDPKLEGAADKLLKESAKHTRKPDGKPFIRANGRGWQEYANFFGIRTKKHDEKARQMEVTGLDLEHALRPIGERHSKRMDDNDE